jgi:hypothetical protein
MKSQSPLWCGNNLKALTMQESTQTVKGRSFQMIDDIEVDGLLGTVHFTSFEIKDWVVICMLARH